MSLNYDPSILQRMHKWTHKIVPHSTQKGSIWIYNMVVWLGHNEDLMVVDVWRGTLGPRLSLLCAHQIGPALHTG